MEPISFEIIKSGEVFKHHLTTYQKLVEQCDQAHYKQRLEYILEVILPNPAYQIRFILLKKNNRAFLIAPFVLYTKEFDITVRTYTLYRKTIPVLSLLGNTFIHKPDISFFQPYELIFKILYQQDLGFKLCELETYPLSSIFLFLHTRKNISCGIKYQKINLTEYIILLPDSFDNFMKGLSKKLQKDIKYYLNKLQNHFGEVILKKINHQDNMTYYYEIMTEIDNNSWKKRPLNSIYEIVGMKNLGWLHLYFLYVKNEPIAFFYIIKPDNDYSKALVYTYKDQWKKYSPGKILFIKCIQDLIKTQKIKTLDLGDGYTLIKAQISNKTVQIESYLFYKRCSYLALLLGIINFSAWFLKLIRKIFNKK